MHSNDPELEDLIRFRAWRVCRRRVARIEEVSDCLLSVACHEILGDLTFGVNALWPLIQERESASSPYVASGSGYALQQ